MLQDKSLKGATFVAIEYAKHVIFFQFFAKCPHFRSDSWGMSLIKFSTQEYCLEFFALQEVIYTDLENHKRR